MCDRITYQNDHKYFETIFGFLDALEIQIGCFFLFEYKSQDWRTEIMVSYCEKTNLECCLFEVLEPPNEIMSKN